jgi:AraC family transcriptional regulator, regulatory protein of adaptative response / methylated-DNA-[protein]-cysteine methyltransferase
MRFIKMPTHTNHSHDAQRWQAVLARDSSMDAAFVYAVRSTGIYCRPSCPSRRPRREQVAFFSQPVIAEKAGFRACLRCKPSSNGDGAPNDDARAVARLCREIEMQIAQNPDQALKLADLSERAGISSHSVHRMFRKMIGITPRQFADALRLRRLKGRLQRGDSVTTALYEAGYGSASRLYEYANAQLGMTPATYRHGGRGMEIVYTIEECPQGRVLVAATDRGVSAVYLGDQDRPLERALREEYPNANIRKGSGTLGPWVRSIVKHLRGGEKHLDLPLDVEATAFQRRVWQELQKIPYGTTKTYSQVAQALGQPTAARAVARACATNPVSIVVPCHRVVREGGQLAGYRWGLDRKRALIEQEQKSAG